MPLGRNPFVWTLWFVSAGLVLGGFLLFWWSSGDSRGFSWEGSVPPFEFVLQQSVWVMVPAMVTVGLAGMIGLLFLSASRWRPGGAFEESHSDSEPRAGDHRDDSGSLLTHPGSPDAGSRAP